MNAFDVLGDPVRRKILELLRDGQKSSGEIVDAIAAEFGITQAAVSQHLKVLRESGFATVTPHGTKRIYHFQPGPLKDVDNWLGSFRGFWVDALDSLAEKVKDENKNNAPE